MPKKQRTRRDAVLIEQDLVPAAIAAAWGQYALSSVHRAVASGRLTGHRLHRRLYVHWPSFLGYVGALAPSLPQTARAALEIQAEA